MKLCLSALVLIVCCMFAPWAHAGDAILLCSADSPPWTIKTGDAPCDIEGLAVDIMNELFRRADMDVEMMAYPFKRCLKYVREGTLDGCFMTIRNEERQTYAEFTAPYLAIPTFIFYSPDRLGSFEWEAWSDLKPYRIGSQRGFKYGQAFTRALEEVPLNIVEIPSVKVGIEMVQSGRIDMVLSNEFRFRYLTRNHPELRGLLVKAQKPVGTGIVYVALSKLSRHVAMIPRLNELLAQMQEDGAIDAIVESFLEAEPQE